MVMTSRYPDLSAADLPTVEQISASRPSLTSPAPAELEATVVVDMPGIGTAHPLSGPYCAERAAFAISRAETAGTAEIAQQLLNSAGQWRELAVAMATHGPLNRPREDDERRR